MWLTTGFTAGLAGALMHASELWPWLPEAPPALAEGWCDADGLPSGAAFAHENHGEGLRRLISLGEARGEQARGLLMGVLVADIVTVEGGDGECGSGHPCGLQGPRLCVDAVAEPSDIPDTLCSRSRTRCSACCSRARRTLISWSWAQMRSLRLWSSARACRTSSPKAAASSLLARSSSPSTTFCEGTLEFDPPTSDMVLLHVLVCPTPSADDVSSPMAKSGEVSVSRRSRGPLVRTGLAVSGGVAMAALVAVVDAISCVAGCLAFDCAVWPQASWLALLPPRSASAVAPSGSRLATPWFILSTMLCIVSLLAEPRQSSWTPPPTALHPPTLLPPMLPTLPGPRDGLLPKAKLGTTPCRMVHGLSDGALSSSSQGSDAAVGDISAPSLNVPALALRSPLSTRCTI